MASKFVGLLIFALCLAIVSCLQCYSCDREDNQDAEKYCALLQSSKLGNNTKVNCSEDENHCLITKRIKGKSVDLFKRKCAGESKCADDRDCSERDKAGVIICNSCCDEDLCNIGEGPTGLPQTSGSSRIHMIMGLSQFGPLLIWFLHRRS